MVEFLKKNLQKILVLVVVIILYSVSAALTPFFIGITVAYISLPVISIIKRFFGDGITVGVMMTYLLLAALLLIIAPFLYNKVVDITQSISSLKLNLNNLQFGDEAEQVIDSIRKQLIGKIPVYLASIGSAVISSTQAIISLIFSIIFAPIISIYFLQDIHYKQQHWIISYLGKLSENFVKVQIGMIAFYIGFYIILLSVVGIKDSLTLSFICGILYIIPYIGPISGCVISGMLAIVQYGIDFHLVVVIIGFIGINIIDTIFISPRFIGPRFGLHPLMTIFSVLVNSYLFGVVGMILAIPLGVIIKDLWLWLVNLSYEKQAKGKA